MSDAGDALRPATAAATGAVIRPAAAGDAGAIATVHVATWQVAYRGLLPDEHLDRLDVAARRRRWDAILAEVDWPRTGTLVAQSAPAGGIIGFASVGPSRDDDATPRLGELWAIYVAPAEWGRGVGRELMAAALQALSAAGFDAATLWVLAGNLRARRFYAAGGWAPDGAARTDRRGGLVLDEVRYRRALR